MSRGGGSGTAHQYSQAGSRVYSGERRVRRRAINSKVTIGGVSFLILLIVLIVASFFIGQTLVYIFIILAALFSLIAFALLGYAALQIIELVKEVRAEVNTLVGTAKDTMTEVQGTARFVSDNIVQPVSQAVGFLSAARATAKAFTEPLYKRRS